jgi:hypothetical protein
MESLSELLRDKSLEFYTRYAYIRELAGSGFQRYATMIGYLTDHGEQHYRNLETNLSLLLPDEMKQHLAVEELFVLLCAVHFHDVGLLSEHYTDEPWTSVREDHVNRTYDYLHEFYEDWGLNRFEAYAIKNICLGHSGDTLYDLPEDSVIHRTLVRIQFLAALLRVADELDLDYTRVSPFILRLKQIPEESLKHWKKHEEIGGVLIDSKSWTIEVRAMPMSEEGRTIIESLVEQKLQSELEYVRPILEKHGLYYRQVTVKYESFGEKRSIGDHLVEKTAKRAEAAEGPKIAVGVQALSPSSPVKSESNVVQIFLCYARPDQRKVEKLYDRLSDSGFSPWMDKKDILPGEIWEATIQKAIRGSDFFLMCLSANSVNRRGQIQKEVKQALDIWKEKLDSDIYLIPVRLEDCVVPESLRRFQWVNLFEEDGWTLLVKAIQAGMERRM